MSTYVLRPNATLTTNDVNRTGGATVNGVLSDSNDSTWMQYFFSGSAVAQIDVGLDDLPGLASNERIVSVAVSARWDTGAGNTSFYLYLAASDGNVASDFYSANVPSLTTFTGPYKTTSGSGATWTAALVNSMYLSTFDNAAGTTMPRVTEMYVTVYTNFSPVATPTAPTGTIQNSTRPTTTWTYADTESDAQQQYQVKIFDSATYSAGGFDASTSTAVWDSGNVLSNATSVTIGTSLTNGTTYKAYVRAADQTGFGVFTAGPAFTIAIDPPATPTIVATADNTNSRIVLTLNGFDNLLTTNQGSLETDTTGWTALTNCSIARSTAQFLDGAASLALTSSAGGSMSATTPTGVSGVAISPNIAYRILANFRTAVSARSVNVGVKWYKSDGTASATPSNTGSNVTDSAANFSTQATLLVTSPADAAYAAVIVTVVSTGAGAEVHYVDDILLAPGTSITWTRGGLTSTQKLIISRSADNGVTWTTLTRNFPVSPSTIDSSGQISLLPVTTQAAVTYDYETTRGTTYYYRAYVLATDSGYELDSAYSTTTSQMISIPNDQCKWNFKVPETPSLNVLSATIASSGSFLPRSRHEQAGIFTAIGRTKKVKVTDVVLGDEFPLTILCTTAAQYASIIAMLNAQKTILVQDPTGRQWYMGVDSDVSINDSLIPSLYFREITIHLVEVDAP